MSSVKKLLPMNSTAQLSMLIWILSSKLVNPCLISRVNLHGTKSRAVVCTFYIPQALPAVLWNRRPFPILRGHSHEARPSHIPGQKMNRNQTNQTTRQERNAKPNWLKSTSASRAISDSRGRSPVSRANLTWQVYEPFRHHEASVKGLQYSKTAGKKIWSLSE